MQNSFAYQHTFGRIILAIALTFALLHPSLATAQDCNGNGISDFCDLDCSQFSSCNVPGCGMSQDCNGNGIPDECDPLIAFSDQHTISTSCDEPFSVFSADLDGDGDPDVVSASIRDDKIAWFENTDGLGSFGAEQIITTATDGAIAVFVADLDGDGDADVLSASLWDDTIAWYENTDGLGSFGPQRIITNIADGATDVFAADLDGDDDTDVVSASREDDTVAWYENEDGLGNFGAPQVISNSADYVQAIHIADLDGDNDKDILSASAVDGIIGWFENLDGLGSFGSRQVINPGGALGTTTVYAADLDGDGDMDVLSSSGSVNSLVLWYENIDGQGNFNDIQAIASNIDGLWSVIAEDLDNDGDFDVLYADKRGDIVAWFENVDGLASFGPEQIISSSAQGAVAVFTADVDGDGDIDVLSASSRSDEVAWHENTTNDCNANSIPDECEPDTNNNSIPDECELPCGSLQLGDIDASGTVNLADVGIFATAVLDPDSLTGDPSCAADINQDGNLNGADIQGFIELVLLP